MTVNRRIAAAQQCAAHHEPGMVTGRAAVSGSVTDGGFGASGDESDCLSIRPGPVTIYSHIIVMGHVDAAHVMATSRSARQHWCRNDYLQLKRRGRGRH